MSDESTSARRVPLDRLTWNRFARAIRSFLASQVGGRARLMLAGLVSFLLVINCLNVLNSYVGRDFITAITERNRDGFIRFAILYVAVFAASTLVAVVHRFIEERLGLLWRNWLTGRLLHAYLEHPTSYRLSDRLRTNGEMCLCRCLSYESGVRERLAVSRPGRSSAAK